jgi:hypothetical protein
MSYQAPLCSERFTQKTIFNQHFRMQIAKGIYQVMEAELYEPRETSSSEKISEVSDVSQNGSGEEGTALVPDRETSLLIDRIINISAGFIPAYEKLQSVIQRNRQEIILLKNAFGVRQGYGGRMFVIRETPFTWKRFVRQYLSLTPRRLNQLLDVKDDKGERRVVPETEKPLYKKGVAAGLAKAERQRTVELLESGASCAVDRKHDSVLYFRQFKEDKNQFSIELVEIVLSVYDANAARAIGVLFAQEIEGRLASASSSSSQGSNRDAA